jgi:serine/threonine protein kinase
MGWRHRLRLPLSVPIASALDDEIARLELLVLYGWQGVAALGFLVSVSTVVLFPRFGVVPFVGSAGLGLWFSLVAHFTKRGEGRLLREWLNPGVESTVPWVAVLLLAENQGAPYALGSWVPPMLYGCVMSVGILRLRPLGPLLIGLLGAVEYELVYSLYIRSHLSADALELPLFGPRMQLVRSSSVFLGGVLASVLTIGLQRAIGKAATVVRAQDLFGKYRLERPIAAGGMATVYAATYCPEGGFERPVAIKRIHPHLARLASFVDAFRNEAELCARLVHPNIVQVFDFGRVDETYFLAMEFVDGVTLGAIMKSLRDSSESLSPRLVAWIGKEMLEGLAYSHSGARDAGGGLLRVVHRDLSPANVLVSRNGEVKLSDFGLARALRGASAYVTQSIAGHLSYMAPEQATGHETDERSDLFAIGVILWELLAGRALFRREYEGATLLAIVNDPIPAPSSLRADLGAAAWDPLFARALRRDPAERFQTARDMAEELARILDQTGAPQEVELPELVSKIAEDTQRRAFRDDMPTVPASDFVDSSTSGGHHPGHEREGSVVGSVGGAPGRGRDDTAPPGR